MLSEDLLSFLLSVGSIPVCVAGALPRQQFLDINLIERIEFFIRNLLLTGDSTASLDILREMVLAVEHGVEAQGVEIVERL
jgi:hypothetical protein